MLQTHRGAVAGSHRATRAVIDLGAIAHNMRVLREAVGPNVGVAAVVKANAYGHGAAPVARACLEAGAGWLAVGTVDEGVALRQEGIDARILVIGPSVPEEYAEALEQEIALAVGSLSTAAQLAAAARSLGRIARIHVKIDTGLSRFGIPAAEAVEEVMALSALPGLHIDGIYTHLAAAEETDKASARAQMAVFAEILRSLERRGIAVGQRHAANSAAALELPESHLDLVRCGIALYGYPPAGFGADPRGLRPALSVQTRLARVAEVPAGAGVGYNHTYTTTRPTLLGTVPLGYADGLPRLLSNRGQMLVGGQRCPIVGGVCMDQTILDLSAVPGATEGDPVVAIGRQGEETIGADEIGALCDSNAYEVLCRVSPRVPHDYLPM